MLKGTSLTKCNVTDKLRDHGLNIVIVVLFQSCLKLSLSRMTNTENILKPEYVNILKSPGIDSQPDGPERQPYLTYRDPRIHRLVESTPWNRLLGTLNVYKFRL